MSVTAILLNYQRPENMLRLIESLRSQTIRPRILLIDNSSEGLLVHGFSDKVDRLVRIPWNAGCPIRTFMGFSAETEKIMWIDDDLCPRTPTFVEEAIASHEKNCPDTILGAVGRRFYATPPHYGKARQGLDIESGKAAIVKGRFMLFPKKLLAKVRVLSWPTHSNLDYIRKCDDIYFSLETGRGKTVHHIDESLLKGLRELPQRRMGHSWEKDHYNLREKFCADYIASGGLT